ncbi:EAL domain-containing protein [Aquicoccus sp. G2-2]|uniref:EAL domain-containing protein n=1 Tax=Aquicoccus sp. G2-2 TaxID=3092120 RepID=UPI002ADF7A8F|nr:EAL domain-containing protein [Aquicoccus sp. G2-2]MEA1112506.1 EAL domain-containing protein [Aquicoccus sp. G2-2]
MPRGNKGIWADVPAGHEDPVSYAVQSRRRSTLEMVDAAVRHKQVLLAFQPIVQAARPGFIAFYEGLIRVQDADGRVIPAKDFIHEIEQTETGRILDCIALEKGLKVLARQPDLRLAINMSARSIGYERWIDTLKRGLLADATAAERLILEITESSAMLVPELVSSFMAKLCGEGISFALDDFGAGLTSFRYLRDFYFDILKIDGQFVRGIHNNPDNQVLARALVGVARQFDMFTVAEFVENAPDAAYLANIGVDCLQGYYFGAPTVNPAWAQPEKLRASA